MKANPRKSEKPKAPAAKRGRKPSRAALVQKRDSAPARAVHAEALVVPQQADGCRVKVDNAGRILVPAKIRRELSIKPGSNVQLRVMDGLLEVRTQMYRLMRAQEFVAKHKVAGRSAVQELIAERRAEARREEESA